MPNIQVDSAFLQELATRIGQIVSSMEENSHAYHAAVQAAEADWQGQLRQRFSEKYEQFRSTNDTAVREGQELIQRLRHVIARFEQVDAGSSALSLPL